ncbi:MAG: crotonase/enoyl-CoA hydratase family protein [Acidimicrobiales bacterium]|nr:crotonase/enoyl-CoA hydratase family protein [Acidimicrobiales bacterium]
MVETEIHGNVLVMKINRPEARNAVNADVAQGIEAGIDQLESDDALWVGILTGTREFFCAGADLKLINAGKAGEMMTPKGGFAGIVTRDRSKPIIAAVEGPALAGGTEIVLSCDLVVASRASRFGIPEVKRSLVAAAGGLFRLPRVLPRNIALELGLTGDPIDAERAYHFGLVNRLAEPGQALEAALELATQITANAPLAVQATRRLMFELKDVDDQTGIQKSNEAMLSLFGTEDFTEGLTAFIEKRPPQWKGR